MPQSWLLVPGQRPTPTAWCWGLALLAVSGFSSLWRGDIVLQDVCWGLVRQSSVSTTQSFHVGLETAVADVQTVNGGGLFPIEETDGVHLGVVATTDMSPVSLCLVFHLLFKPSLLGSNFSCPTLMQLVHKCLPLLLVDTIDVADIWNKINMWYINRHVQNSLQA